MSGSGSHRGGRDGGEHHKQLSNEEPALKQRRTDFKRGPAEDVILWPSLHRREILRAAYNVGELEWELPLQKRHVGTESSFGLGCRLADVDVFWHPPLVRPSHVLLDDRLATLSYRALHPCRVAISNAWVRCLFIWEQYEEDQASIETRAPCENCGLLSGEVCEGLDATWTHAGWFCGFALCSFCRRLFGCCRRCMYWQGIPRGFSQQTATWCERVPAREPCGEATRLAVNSEPVPMSAFTPIMHLALTVFCEQADQANTSIAGCDDWLQYVFTLAVGPHYGVQTFTKDEHGAVVWIDGGRMQRQGAERPVQPAQAQPTCR